MAGRLTANAVERLLDTLSARDRGIVEDVARNRVLTATQLTRLHFVDISPSSRDRVRRRVMARLVGRGVLATLERRIGGFRAGSAGLVFALGVAGQRVLSLLAPEFAGDLPKRARQPRTPGDRFLAHSLATSELYVQLREHERAKLLTLGRWAVEAAAAYPNGFGGVMKPDATALLQSGQIEDSWAIEVDCATESQPTLRRKLLAYVDFANTGQLGPDGVIPRVLVAVAHERRSIVEKRFTAIQELITHLPAPALQLIHVMPIHQAVPNLLNILIS
jgi:Replication-relaxation